MIGVFVSLLIAAVLIIFALMIVDMMPVDVRFKQILKIVCLLLAFVWLLQEFAIHAGGYYIRY